ncbi:MAG: hypothetical protein ACYSUY_01120 [Planctomycetota bacterium]|jgi:hypothetical protein
MRNQGISWLLMIVWTLCFYTLPAQAKYGGGSGTAGDPYLIYTSEQMNAVGTNPDDWRKQFKLMADIDFGGSTQTKFNFIGYSGKPFSGVFDGNRHSIYDFEPVNSCVSWLSGWSAPVFGPCVMRVFHTFCPCLE